MLAWRPPAGQNDGIADQRQNVVPYGDLGAATSGVTFFRSIGGSFGTAVFGAIFSAQLGGNLRHYLAGKPIPSGFNPSAGSSPAALAKLPPAVHLGYEQAFAASLHTVFLVAVPISAVAFGLSWLLKEVPLRKTSTATNQAQSLAPTAVPAACRSLDEMGRALSVLASGQNRDRIYERLADRAGVTLDAAGCWMLLRVQEQPDDDAATRSRRLGLPEETIRLLLGNLAGRGLVTLANGPGRGEPGTASLPGRTDQPGPADGNGPANGSGRAAGGPGQAADGPGRAAQGTGRAADGPGQAAQGPGQAADGRVQLTERGEATASRLITARRDALSELVRDWEPEKNAELAQLLTRLARYLSEGRAPAGAAPERTAAA